MCGRYANSRSSSDLVAEFDLVPPGDDVLERLEPDYNVAPTKPVPAVVARAPRHDRGAPPERQLRVVSWGLVPSWAKDPKIGNRLINARMETVAEKPSFRRAFARRRALLPADGYYEWYVGDEVDSRGKPVKQPFFIRPADGGVLAMAGLYEIWRDPTVADDDAPDAFRWTSTVITTSAEDSLGRIHDRMPLLVDPDRWGAWLDPGVDDRDELLALLEPAAPGRLVATPVSREVNDVRHNGPQLVEPVDLDESGLHPA